jgi:hypothetical protein
MYKYKTILFIIGFLCFISLTFAGFESNFNEIFSILIVLLLIIVVIVGFIRISIRLRRGGGSFTTIGLGATDEFLTKDKKKSAETIVNLNAGKRFEE